ncbi:MAG: hypothetical protein GY944_13105, partial [bacterium]|nr:hypothetical protein [bacterium]
SVIRLGSLSFGMGALLLLAMAFAPWPFAFEFPGAVVLSGDVALPAEEFARYKQAMGWLYALDEAFIATWVVAWSIVSLEIKKSNAGLGSLLLAVGLLGPLLDIVENGLVWYQLGMIESGLPPSDALALLWQGIRHTSYVIPFAASLLLFIGLWQCGMIGVASLLCASVVSLLAIVATALPAIAWIADLWWLVFFAAGAWVLWRASTCAHEVS